MQVFDNITQIIFRAKCVIEHSVAHTKEPPSNDWVVKHIEEELKDVLYELKEIREDIKDVPRTFADPYTHQETVMNLDKHISYIMYLIDCMHGEVYRHKNGGEALDKSLSDHRNLIMHAFNYMIDDLHSNLEHNWTSYLKLKHEYENPSSKQTGN